MTDIIKDKDVLLKDDNKTKTRNESIDKEIKALIKQSEDTIKSKYGPNSNRIELECLNRYSSVYKNTDPQEHFEYFQNIYKKKRLEILDTIKDDKWIRLGNINVQFGEGTKVSSEMENKRKKIKIMLSDIYKIALDLQSIAEKTLDGIDDQMANESVGKDLIRPNILLLHLTRIFYFLNDDLDKDKLGEIVTHLETVLCVTKRTVIPDSMKIVDQTVNSPGMSNGLTSLFTMATSMMEKMGYKPPPGMKPPSDGEISQVINTVFGNETTQNVIHGMFSSLKDRNDFGTAVQEIIKNVTDPKTLESIQDSVKQTAHLANEMGLQNPPPIPEHFQ